MKRPQPDQLWPRRTTRPKLVEGQIQRVFEQLEVAPELPHRVEKVARRHRDGRRSSEQGTHPPRRPGREARQIAPPEGEDDGLPESVCSPAHHFTPEERGPAEEIDHRNVVAGPPQESCRHHVPTPGEPSDSTGGRHERPTAGRQPRRKLLHHRPASAFCRQEDGHQKQSRRAFNVSFRPGGELPPASLRCPDYDLPLIDRLGPVPEELQQIRVIEATVLLRAVEMKVDTTARS